jgi:hypothetical protein
MPVDAMTPTEPVETPAFIDMNADEARAITEAIKGAVEQVFELIKDAYNRRAWLALGYRTWDTWCAKEFRTAPLMVPREERPEMVRSMRQAGLSQRAIASATGVSQKTVDRDLDATESNDSVEMPDKVTGLDGKKRPAQQPKPDVPQPKPTPKEPDSGPAPTPKPDAPKPKPKGQATVEANDELPRIDWTSIPVTSQKKINAIVRRLWKEAMAEFESRVRDEVERREDVLYNVIRMQYQKIQSFESAQRDFWSAQRDGVITEADWKLIRQCLHPDTATLKCDDLACACHTIKHGERAISKETLSQAFRMWTDAKTKIKFIPPSRPSSSDLPQQTLDEL